MSTHGNNNAPRFFPLGFFPHPMNFVVVIIVLVFLFFVIREGRDAARRAACVGSLQQIGIALWNYHDTHQTFPPAYFADADGGPMHSWRVILLPYFEEEGLKKLYDDYDFNEPWNGPHNRKLADRMPYVYRCPSSEAPDQDTSYVAIVGDEAGWPAPQCASARDITDGLSNTIALAEVANAGIQWMEPRDLTFPQACLGINPPLSKMAISSNHTDGADCLFFDTSVHFLQNDIPVDLLRALLTANGGEAAEPPYD